MVRRNGRSAVLGTLAACSLLAAGCEKATYKVEGTGKATVTYKDGDMHTEKDVTLPWSKEITRAKEMDLKAKGKGELTCTITTKEGVKEYYGSDGSCGLTTE